MNKKQLSEHIGNIDDRLVEQAENIPNYRQLHHRQTIRRFLTAAATFVLMACSFSVGAFAFARETVVEVPVEQETIKLEEINLTLILPDDWKGKYSVETNGQNYIVFTHRSEKMSVRESTHLTAVSCFILSAMRNP